MIILPNSHCITYTFLSIKAWENVRYGLGSESVKHLWPIWQTPLSVPCSVAFFIVAIFLFHRHEF